MSDPQISYEIELARARVGWVASVDCVMPHGTIALSGPTYWRPTREQALTRAERHVNRKLAQDARKANAEHRVYRQRPSA